LGGKFDLGLFFGNLFGKWQIFSQDFASNSSVIFEKEREQFEENLKVALKRVLYLEDNPNFFNCAPKSPKGDFKH